VSIDRRFWKNHPLLMLAAVLCIAGCGSSNGAKTNQLSNQATLVAVVTPSTVTYGTTATLSATGGSGNGAVSFSIGTSTGCSVSGTTLSVTNASSTCAVTATKAADSNYYSADSAPVTVTLVKATSTISWTPLSTITSDDTLVNVLTATSTTLGPITYTATPTGGTATTVTATSTLAPGSYTLTATLAPSDSNNWKSATMSVQLTVTQAPPKLISIDKPLVYCESFGGGCGVIFTLTTKNAQAGDTFTVAPYVGSITLKTGTDPNKIVYLMYFNSNIYSPGWFTFQECRPDGVTCSGKLPIWFPGPTNTLAVSAGGELFQLDQARNLAQYNEYIDKFKANGATITPNGSFQLPDQFIIRHSIAYDDTTNLLLVDCTAYDAAGNWTDGCTGTVSGVATGTAAKNGLGATTWPSSNSLLTYPIGNALQNTSAITVGLQPSAVAVGTVGAETDALVFSRDGTPTLWNYSLPGLVSRGETPLPGITPISTVQAPNPLMGGWQISYAEKGTAKGTAAVLSTPDSLLVFVNATTMKETISVPLASTNLGVPFRIAYDTTHGNFVVAFADQPNALTRFASINPSTGAITNMTSTSTLLAVGFAVSADGNYLYVCNRDVCETQPNK